MDNDHADRVIVFLGDLGRDLPKASEDYWHSFNIAPDSKLSETGYRRAILGDSQTRNPLTCVFALATISSFETGRSRQAGQCTANL